MEKKRSFNLVTQILFLILFMVHYFLDFCSNVNGVFDLSFLYRSLIKSTYFLSDCTVSRCFNGESTGAMSSGFTSKCSCTASAATPGASKSTGSDATGVTICTRNTQHTVTTHACNSIHLRNITKLNWNLPKFTPTHYFLLSSAYVPVKAFRCEVRLFNLNNFCCIQLLSNRAPIYYLWVIHSGAATETTRHQTLKFAQNTAALNLMANSFYTASQTQPAHTSSLSTSHTSAANVGWVT